MSEKGGFEILDIENGAAIGDIAEKPIGPRPQLVAKRNLVDVTNLPEKRLSLSIPTTVKEYIEKLQKENVNLSKMLWQRNKLVELSGIELEKLRINLIAMQEQNRKLAVSHTQLLAELNSGRNRLKELHHVLGCQNGLLKARNLEFKVNSNKPLIEEESPKEIRIAKRRLRSNSLGSSEPSQSEENATKRPATGRRSSARFKTVEVESREAGDDAEFSKCPSLDEPVFENGSNSVLSSIKVEDSIYGPRGPRRSSLCRPPRMAAKKVQSYKEIPLNVKMRRSE